MWIPHAVAHCGKRQTWGPAVFHGLIIAQMIIVKWGTDVRIYLHAHRHTSGAFYQIKKNKYTMLIAFVHSYTHSLIYSFFHSFICKTFVKQNWKKKSYNIASWVSLPRSTNK